MNCKICNTASFHFYTESRTFYKCPECHLIFTNAIPDKESYEKHYISQWQKQDNTFWDSQVHYLLLIIEKYKQPEYILDFGSGSGELTKKLQQQGYNVTPLDPIINGYLKDQHYPSPFDVIVGLEVIEHLTNLLEEIHELNKTLTDDGIIIFSTMLTNNFIDSSDAQEQFAKWWYKNDPTHINFFCNKSLAKLGELGNFDVDIYENKVFVLRKNRVSKT